MMITNQKGFTLLELLVVLVIVGMAASFSGPQLWQSYAKASERSVLQTFADDLEKIRVEAFHQQRSIVLAVEGSTNQIAMPDLPEGWRIEKSSPLRFLPTGVTNGGTLYFLSPDSHRWKLKLQALDGTVEISRL